MAIVGGAKVSTKLDLLGNLLSKVDVLVIGGGMANTFLHAQGIAIGKSLAEREMADTAREILAKGKARGVRDRPAGGCGGGRGAEARASRPAPSPSTRCRPIA